MTVPLIGVTTTRVKNKYGYPIVMIPEAYTRSIFEAGGAPVMIPLGLDDEALRKITTNLDGILFTGGGDVHPALYGSNDSPKVDQVDNDRDRIEISLFKDLTQAGVPFLGICRGLQLINVALGGSLYTDIKDQQPAALEHSCFPAHPRDFLAHNVKVEPASRLAQILGQTETQVNSLHHQAIRQLGPGLSISGLAPDGVIEGIELKDYPFGLAVQWHPESLPEMASMRALFRAFVEAADGGQR